MGRLQAIRAVHGGVHVIDVDSKCVVAIVYLKPSFSFLTNIALALLDFVKSERTSLRLKEKASIQT